MEYKERIKNWDYYTLLWSKEKSEEFNELKFGFRFKDIEKYLDKCIEYLEKIYTKIICLIEEYKTELSDNKIANSDDPMEQLNI